jgi:hypothetical protein
MLYFFLATFTSSSSITLIQDLNFFKKCVCVFAAISRAVCIASVNFIYRFVRRVCQKKTYYSAIRFETSGKSSNFCVLTRQFLIKDSRLFVKINQIFKSNFEIFVL